MSEYDAIVIGSGLSGVHAATPLVEQGFHVAILDVGHTGADLESDERSFENIRRADADQYKIFLGDDFSGIDLGQGHFRAMVSGQRSFVTKGSEEYAPLSQKGTLIPQSFARGGFSEAWSGGCEIFDSSELEAVGLPGEEMKRNYEAIVKRIGVSGISDDFSLQPPLKLDDAATELEKRYTAHKSEIREQGFVIRRPMHAILTESLGDRLPHTYRDMDYWDNGDRALYRAHYSLEDLQKRSNFTYVSGMFALTVRDSTAGAEIRVRDITDGSTKTYAARTVVLAAGAINTTRLLLRSFDRYDTPAPIILKNHYYIPCLFPARFGKRPDPRRHSLAQLTMHGLARKNGMSELYGQLLTYNSLLLSKLVRYVPLPVPEAFSILSILAPALIFADIRFPSVSDSDHYAMLRKTDCGDEFDIHYPDSMHLKRMQNSIVRKAKGTLRSLGLFPLMAERHGFSMQSHYAGGIPIAERVSDRLSVRQNGQLHGHENIFVADASSWRALPAKPSGLTIMANANRVGEEVARFLS